MVNWNMNSSHKESDSHSMPNADLDWDRYSVRRFIMKYFHENMLDSDWEKLYEYYSIDFLQKSWTFEKFKYIAQFDCYWNSDLERLKKLQNLNIFI